MFAVGSREAGAKPGPINDPAKENAVPAGPRNGAESTSEKKCANGEYDADSSRATVKRDPHSILEAIGKHSKSRLGVRAVLTVLASHVRYTGDDAQACFPSQRKIAELAHVTVRTVQRAIKKLVELGEIEIIEIGNGHRSTRYRLTILNALTKLSPLGRQKRHPNLSPTRGERKKPRTGRPRPSAQRPSHARRILMATTGRGSHTASSDARPAQRDRAVTGPDAVPGRESGGAEKWRSVTADAVAGAKRLCSPDRWEALKAAVVRDGTRPEGVEAEATRRWRAGRIQRGEPLGDEVCHVA